MGEAKRRKTLGLSPKKNNTKIKFDDSPRLFEWLPFTINQRDSLIKLSIKASWFGIGGLIILDGRANKRNWGRLLLQNIQPSKKINYMLPFD